MEVLPSSRIPVRTIFSAAVIVSALGYLVDIYDLLLFSIIRVPSLKSLGLTGPALLDTGIYLLNIQMAGMLIGGIAWGVLGDKKGRLSVLFGSIILYSLANIANGFVLTVDQYAVLRFIAGIGLAGELGAGVTLVSELLPKEHRGYGTALITAVGMGGALLAWTISQNYDWRTCFWIGGGLGFLLLTLRVGVLESSMFHKMSALSVNRGQILSLFTNSKRFGKYARCILIALPTWYLIGILMTFAPEFAKALGVQGAITGGEAIFWCYLGQAVGGLTSGITSQVLHSRKTVIRLFILALATFVTCYFLQGSSSTTTFYTICGLLGIANGYWALFITVAAEQFGTNLRATVTTTVPNFVRGSLVPIALGFQWLKGYLTNAYGPDNGIVYAGIIIGAVTLIIALLSLHGLDETFGKDLDYVET